MKQSTPYHMRGVIQFADGTSFDDSDFTFTTGALPAALVPNLTVTTTAGHDAAKRRRAAGFDQLRRRDRPVPDW